MRRASLLALTATALLVGCRSFPAPLTDDDGLGVKQVSFRHPGGKGSFKVVMSSQAVYVDYHAYMTKDAEFVELVDRETWTAVARAIVERDYESETDRPTSAIHILIYYTNGKRESGYVQWSSDVVKGAALRKAYKTFLGRAARY